MNKQFAGFAVLLALFLLVSGCLDQTGGAFQFVRIAQPDPTGIVCADTDATPTFPNGNNIRLQGTARQVQDEDIVLSFGTDSCISGTVLREYFCQGTSIQSQQTTCPSWMPCTNGACNPQEPTCGNGIIESGEQCDGIHLGQTCQSVGFPGGGILECSGCQFNTLGCLYNLCGNGVCESPNETPATCPQDCPGTQQIILKDTKGYPYDPNQASNFPWRVSIVRDTCSASSVCKIAIFNYATNWSDIIGPYIQPPLYVPSQALTQTGVEGNDTAWFLFDAPFGTPGKNFFAYRNRGFTGGGTGPAMYQFITNTHQMNLGTYSIPLFIQLLDDSSPSSFMFGGRTLYYASTSTDYNGWDGNATFSIAPIPSSTSSDFLVTASDGRHTMYWKDAVSVVADPGFVELPAIDGRLIRYRIYSDAAASGDLYLILDSGIFSRPPETTGIPDIMFLGTDVGEDGFLGRNYYWPNLPDFGGGIPSQFFVAVFEIETGGNYVSGLEYPPDFDTRIYIDTGRGDLLNAPNPQVSHYDAPLEYNFSNRDGPVSFDMSTRSTPSQLQEAYNDWGTKIDFIVSGPQEVLSPMLQIYSSARRGFFEITKQNPTGGFDTREFTTGTGPGESGTNFNSFAQTPEFIFEIGKESLPSLMDAETLIHVDGTTELRHFQEKIIGNFDQLFDYTTTNNSVADLEGTIEGMDMGYYIYLGDGIPSNFVDEANDDITIPFFGEWWKVVSTGPDAQGVFTIVLEQTLVYDIPLEQTVGGFNGDNDYACQEVKIRLDGINCYAGPNDPFECFNADFTLLDSLDNPIVTKTVVVGENLKDVLTSNGIAALLDSVVIDGIFYDGVNWTIAYGQPDCNAATEICDNGFDDDSDLLVDCADPNCYADPVCNPGYEAICNDGIDNDGDGFTDCEDGACFGQVCYVGGSLCSVNYTCIERTDFCQDGMDNDGDRLTDCLDADCSQSPACAPGVEICNNGIDDDGDTRIDCQDTDCTNTVYCQAPPTCQQTEICGNGTNDDCDEFIEDCGDPDCPACPPG